MKRKTITQSLATVLLAVAMPLTAQVPQLINFQGRIAVGTTNFEGSGQFKFALVNADGSTTYWSNDSSSTGGGEPTAAVTLPVVKGLYSVLLGDATLPNMTVVPSSVFSNGDVHLRVWFNDGVNGFHHLTPDQRIAAVGYAMMAANVPDGSITGDKIAPGAVGASQLAPDAVMGSLDAAGVGFVPSGGVILSEQENNTALLDAGYVKILGTVPKPAWIELAEPETLRFEGETAIWTGSEVIYWGGTDFFFGDITNSGERFNPSTNTWTPMSDEGAPSIRSFPESLWTGSQMIIWGGEDFDLGGPANTGALYDPETDTWTEMSTGGAPLLMFPEVLWAGDRMIVWGGWDPIDGNPTNTGAMYDPETDTWAEISDVNAPVARDSAIILWTGTEMIVWGGFDIDGFPDDTGARYNPATDTWTTMSFVGAPALMYGFENPPVVFWSGAEMLIWGLSGFDEDLGTPIYAGGRYNPATNTWAAMSTEDAPNPFNLDAYDYKPSTAWTGTEMILWFGKDNNGGARYNPATDTWTPISQNQAPDQTSGNSRTLWTGTELLNWGGWFNDTGEYNYGSRYNPATNTWKKISSTNALFAYDPVPTVVWTGSQMIVMPHLEGSHGFLEPPYSYTPSDTDFFFIYQRP